MSKDYWKQALEEARARRELLLDRRGNLADTQKKIDEELGQLEQVISSLLPLAGETPNSELAGFTNNLANIGLADACRAVLQANPDRFISPVGIKKMIEELGYDLKRHNNVLASIHGVVKRLVESDEAIRTTSLGGTSMYKWNPVRQPKLDLGESVQSTDLPRMRNEIKMPPPSQTSPDPRPFGTGIMPRRKKKEE